MRVRWLDAWARTSRPVLWFGLFGLTLARILAWPLAVGAAVLALALMCCGVLTWRLRRPQPLPDWLCVARLDQASQAGGALLRRFETGTSPDPVPVSVLRLPLPRWFPRRLTLQLALWAAAYLACVSIPLPPRAPTPGAAVHVTPLPVQRAQQLLQRLPQKDPHARAFVASSRESLKSIGARSEGLSRADFDAIERIEQQSRSLLARRAEQLASKRDALAELAQLLSEYEAKGGGDQTAPALREALERMRDSLESGSPERAQLQALLQQLGQRSPQAQKAGDRPGQGQGKGAFDPQAAADLRAQIGELQRVVLAEQGKGGATDGPGYARLQHDHETNAPTSTRFESKTFSAQADRETVLLATGSSKRADPPQRGRDAASRRPFDRGNDSEFWDKRMSPHEKQLLERYFDGRHVTATEAAP